MTKNSDSDRSLLILAVIVLGWVIPGLGYAIVKEYKRAIICFFGITLLFILGLYIGSVAVIDSVNYKPWYVAQMLTSPLVHVISTHVNSSHSFSSYGKPAEIGQLYTALAGLLNVLCIIGAAYMAYYGRTELIGEEDA